MNPTNPSSALYEDFIRVKNRVADRYLAYPGVQGIGVGYKEVGGRNTHALAIRFYVRKKRDLPRSEQLPTVIEGIATDVIETGIAPFPALRSPVANAPIVEEISTDPSRLRNGSGTCGLIVAGSSTGKAMLRRNDPVFCFSDGKAQPSRADSATETGDNSGTLER